MKASMFVAAAMALCLATSAAAQNGDQVAIYGCQAAAAETIRTPLPESDSLLFAPNTRVSQKSNEETIVEGYGEFQHRAGSIWHHFTFHCTFDASTGVATDVKIKFSPNGGSGRDDSRKVQRQAPRQAGPRQQGRFS
jgi:hypothetical protein